MHKKSLGFLSILALTVGTMVGVGILIAPSMMYKFGRYGFLAWPIASTLCLSLAIMFSRLSSIVSASGPAGFVHAAFGNLSSFQTSWSHWIGFSSAQAVIVYSFGQYISLEYALPISLIGLWSIAFLSSFMTIFSVRGVLILTSLKVFMLIVIILAGLSYLNPSYILSLNPETGTEYGALMSGVSAALMAFIGLEMATLPSENVKNAKVTVPLATITGTIIAAVLYTISYAVVVSILTPEQLANTNRPMYDVANILLGEYGGSFLKICAGLGFFASINGVLFAQSYILKYSSELKILPKLFNKETKAGFPIYSALFSATVSTIGILLITSDKAWMPVLGGMSVCFISIVYLWSVMAYRHLGGNVVLWCINFITAIAFLAGSLDLNIIPNAVLLYLIGFFVYGMFVTDKKLTKL